MQLKKLFKGARVFFVFALSQIRFEQKVNYFLSSSEHLSVLKCLKAANNFPNFNSTLSLSRGGGDSHLGKLIAEKKGEDYHL